MKSFTVAFGNFIFRWRDTIFTLILLAGFVLLYVDKDSHFGDFDTDIAFSILGLIVLLMGEFVRCFTIGYDYIKRGGLNKQIFAETLVRRGMFAHTRNPMYLGNILIATGAILSINYIWFTLVVLPLFYYIYIAITMAEEKYLGSKFGRDYETYLKEVNRYIPSNLSTWSKSIEGMSFLFKRMVRKEHGTIAVVFTSIILMNLLKFNIRYSIGWESCFSYTMYGLIVGVLLFQITSAILKRTHKLEDPK